MPSLRPTDTFITTFIENAKAFLERERQRAANPQSDKAASTHPVRESLLDVAQGDRIDGYPLGKNLEKIRRWRDELTDLQRVRLEELPGFAWDVMDARWHRNFDEVASYAEAGAAPAEMPPALYVWWTRQLQLAPTPPTMNTERGFATEAARQSYWATRQAAYERDLAHMRLVADLDYSTSGRAFDAFLTALQGWLQAHPGAGIDDIPAGATIETPGRVHHLAKKITYYRRRYNGLEGTHPLPAPDVAALAALPGWSWELDPIHSQNARRKG